jgi:hypothetical protein
MDAAEIAVTVGGVVLVGLILWFFLGPRGARGPRT